jgi:hypothetical protein
VQVSEYSGRALAKIECSASICQIATATMNQAAKQRPDGINASALEIAVWLTIKPQWARFKFNLIAGAASAGAAAA